MKFLLDTDVASAATKKVPPAQVVQWVEEQDRERLHLSVLSAAEMEYGVRRLPHGRRQTDLQLWLDGVLSAFGSRVLMVDAKVASRWGQVRAEAEAAKRTMPLIDAGLAATAEVHGLTLVTRNVRHFEAWGGTGFRSVESRLS